MFVLAILAFLVFGPEGLPGVIKNVARTVRALRQAASDFQTEVRNALDDENERQDIARRQRKDAPLEAGEQSEAVGEETIAKEQSENLPPNAQAETQTGVEPAKLEGEEAPSSDQTELAEPQAAEGGLGEEPGAPVQETVEQPEQETAPEPEPEAESASMDDDDGPGLPMKKKVATSDS